MIELKYVVDNSKYVKINYDKIEELAKAIKNTKYHHWSENLDLNLNGKEWILLVFIIESMNFCFWKKPKWKIIHNEEILSGSTALFHSIIREVENNKDFLTIDYLFKIDHEKFKDLFIAIENEIPFLEERYKSFRATVDFIYHNLNFYEELYNIKTDIELLNYIIKNFKSFDDQSIYKGRTIHFNKRANLLVNDLFYVSEKIRKNLKNVNNLSGCADYAVPRVFRDYGILTYSDELSEIIAKEIEILHDGEMEIEIRANMLYVIELLKEELKKKNIIINAVELDNIIWHMGKFCNKTNSHHCVTIYY